MGGTIYCPIMSAIAMISDKWKVLIIYKLRNGTMRFNELKKALQGVTQRVLTHQLRDLEADGLVLRRVYAEVPPRVEYSLTPLGQTLVPILDRLEEWARDNTEKLHEARKKALANGILAGRACVDLSADEMPEKEMTATEAV